MAIAQIKYAQILLFGINFVLKHLTTCTKGEGYNVITVGIFISRSVVCSGSTGGLVPNLYILRKYRMTGKSIHL